MKPFKTTVGLRSGSKIEVDVKIEWSEDFGDGDYDFDFSMWHAGQQVPDRNVRPRDIDNIMLMVDERVRAQ